jgi:hypothetical protein
MTSKRALDLLVVGLALPVVVLPPGMASARASAPAKDSGRSDLSERA